MTWRGPQQLGMRKMFLVAALLVTHHDAPEQPTQTSLQALKTVMHICHSTFRETNVVHGRVVMHVDKHLAKLKSPSTRRPDRGQSPESHHAFTTSLWHKKYVQRSATPRRAGGQCSSTGSALLPHGYKLLMNLWGDVSGGDISSCHSRKKKGAYQSHVRRL